MTPTPSNWQNLPRHFKVDVARLLDLKSRLALSLCSKSDHEITSDVPFWIDTFSFVKIFPNLRFTNCFIQNHSTVYHQAVKHHLPFETAIACFLNIVKHPKSKIHHLDFHLEFGNDEFYSMLMEGLEAKQYKIHAEKVTFRGDFLNSQGPLLLRLLGFVDSDFLEILHFGAIPSDAFLDHLKRMEQWKMLNGASMCVEKLRNVNLEDFSHLNQLNLRGFKNLNNENKAKIIEIFKTKNPPVPKSFFIISLETKKLRMAIDTRTKIEEHNLSSSEDKLIVEFLENEIRGRLLLNGQDEPFNQLLYQMHS